MQGKLVGLVLVVTSLFAAGATTSFLVAHGAEEVAGLEPYCIQIADGTSDYRPVRSWLDLSILTMWAKREGPLYMQHHAILAVIKDAPPSAHTLMVIGHNPGLHELALMLIASGDVEARERLREKLPTSGLVIIDFAFDEWARLHPQSGRLERFVSPKSLEAAAN